MSQKEFLESQVTYWNKIINNLNAYNQVIKKIATPSSNLPETLIERLDTAIKADWPDLLQPACAQGLAALRKHYIAQDMVDGRVNLLLPADVMTFLTEDKTNIFTPKVMTEISDEALENLIKLRSFDSTTNLSEAQRYEISARSLLIKGKDEAFYEQIVKNGLMSMRNGEKSEPVAASKSVQHFRNAVAALQQYYQNRAKELALPIAGAKKDAEESAAWGKELSAQATDTQSLNAAVAHMSLVIRSTPFASLKEAKQFTQEIEKHIGEFSRSGGKIAPLKPKATKLPLLFGRKRAKEFAAKQTQAIDIVNKHLQSFNPYQLEVLSDVNSPIKTEMTAGGHPQITAKHKKICKLYRNAWLDYQRDERNYERLVAGSSGMAEFLTDSLQKIDKYVTEARKAQKDKAQKKTAELTGIAPDERSGVTKVGQRGRKSIER